MSGLGPVMLMVLAAANPAAGALCVAWRPSNRDQWRPRVVLAVAAAIGLLWTVAALAGPLLDGLSVTVGTWRLATSVPFAVAGLRWMLWPARRSKTSPGRCPSSANRPDRPVHPPAGGRSTGRRRPRRRLAHHGRSSAGGRGHRRPALVPSSAHPLLSVIARLLGGIAVVLAIALGVDGTQTILSATIGSRARPLSRRQQRGTRQTQGGTVTCPRTMERANTRRSRQTCHAWSGGKCRLR